MKGEVRNISSERELQINIKSNNNIEMTGLGTYVFWWTRWMQLNLSLSGLYNAGYYKTVHGLMWLYAVMQDDHIYVYRCLDYTIGWRSHVTFDSWFRVIWYLSLTIEDISICKLSSLGRLLCAIYYSSIYFMYLSFVLFVIIIFIYYLYSFTYFLLAFL